MKRPMAAVMERAGTAERLLVLACLMIPAGGVLLGLQVDGRGDLVGTGYASLAIGALVALVATLVQAAAGGRFPRRSLTLLSAVMGFSGITFLVSGVLAPGGSWMFFEMLLLFWLLARRRTKSQPAGPEIRGSDLLLLSLMLLFRLWITHQGSRHQWELMSIDIPVLSWISLPWLEPIQSVSLGSFTPTELGFPSTGLDFPMTVGLWSVGFALCAGGLYLRHGASREHENDRIHALIRTLPDAVAAMVEGILPEEDWEALGLHGLSDRMLAKRIEALVGERILRQRQFHTAFQAGGLPQILESGGFPGAIVQALGRYSLPEQAETGEKPATTLQVKR